MGCFENYSHSFYDGVPSRRNLHLELDVSNAKDERAHLFRQVLQAFDELVFVLQKLNGRKGTISLN